MLEKFNKFLYSSIILSVLMFVLGLIFMIYPNVSFSVITYIVAVFLIINGIYFIIEKDTSLFFSDFLTLGVLELLMGIIMIINPQIVKTLFPIVVGISMVVKSALDLRISLLLSGSGYKNWLILFICSLLSIICGIYIIINPGIGSEVITTYVGIVIMVYAVSNIIDTIIFKKHVNDIVKLLK